MKNAQIALVFAVLGCGSLELSPEGPRLSPTGEPLAVESSEITIDHEAVVRFQADWNEVITTGPVLAGGRITLEFEPKRLPSCRAYKYGMPAWSILAHYTWDGGPVKTTVLTTKGALLATTFDVPETASKLQVWFYSNDYYGCKEWDTNLGANYSYPIGKPATANVVHFTSDYEEVADGPLTRGGLVTIDYAPSRLPACRFTKNGARAWNEYASWRFQPGGETGTVALFDGDPFAAEPVITRPSVTIPKNATSVAFWFSNSDAAGCVAWDSNFGDNYEFPVVPVAGTPIGWVGDLDFVLVAPNTTQHKGDIDPVYYVDAWQGQPLSSYVEVQMWAQGLTDLPYGSTEAARTASKAVTAEFVTTAVLANDGSPTSIPLTFERQQGNNFVWSYRLGELRWPMNGWNVADGVYRYSVRFSTDGGASWKSAYDKDGGRRLYVGKTIDCSVFPAGGPVECPKTATVGWTGNWGGKFSHACTQTDGLADPVTFTKSSLGHDCMVVTAEVYAAGLTDAGAPSTAIRAEVETDLGFGGGPLATKVTYPLAFDGVVGNNFRFAWSPNQNVGMSDKGDYTFRFRFSADGGKTWTTAGKADGSFRNLWIRNDSMDVTPEQTCDGVVTWDGPMNTFPACMPWGVDTEFDATNCEHWLNALGKGQWSHSGTSATWLEAYTRVGTVDGALLGVGLWVRYTEGGTSHDAWAFGTEIEPKYYRTGFTTARSGPGGTAFNRPVESFAFFIDVKRPTGLVVRLWQSASGANYTPALAFSSPGYVQGIGSGSVEYVPESSAVLSPKHVCQP
jgi:hypothetical protein